MPTKKLRVTELVSFSLYPVHRNSSPDKQHHQILFVSHSNLWFLSVVSYAHQPPSQFTRNKCIFKSPNNFADASCPYSTNINIIVSPINTPSGAINITFSIFVSISKETYHLLNLFLSSSLPNAIAKNVTIYSTIHPLSSLICSWVTCEYSHCWQRSLSSWASAGRRAARHVGI